MRPLKDLTRIVSADILLADEKRASTVKKIKEAIVMDDTRFENLCMTLIHHVIHYYQGLPETINSYYSEPPGLLDHALNRCDAALSLFGQYLLLDENDNLSEEQKLWQYALFSAALIQGIGKLYIDFVVDMYDNHGQFLKTWNPLIESMNLPGCYYLYRFKKEPDLEFRRRVNILLAKSVMPDAGLSWIVSSPEVLASWLALINEDFYAAGTLGAVLSRADAIAIQQFFNQLLGRLNARTARYGRTSTFTDLPDINILEQKIGLEFLQWLQNSLADGKKVINKDLMLVPDGLLVREADFKDFIDAHPEHKGKVWQAIRNGVLSLGLHQVGPDGNFISRFEQKNTKTMQTGIVMMLSMVVPDVVRFHRVSTGQTDPLSATELFYQSQFDTHFTRQQRALAGSTLPSLNKAGQWQKTPVIVAPAPLLNRF